MKIIAIGTVSNVARNKFSGQSIMFDGLVANLRSNGVSVKTIDISPRFLSNSVVLRSFDYVIVLLKVFCQLSTSHYDIAYITTAQSKNGFLRDNAIISLFRLFQVKVIAHQFGANYNQLLDVLNDKGRDRLINMLNYCSKIIVEGQHMKNQYSFLEGYGEKVKIIPNGLPTVGKSAMQPKHYSQEEPFGMYYLSNLIWSKGYFDVL